jgi:hypothetical protein
VLSRGMAAEIAAFSGRFKTINMQVFYAFIGSVASACNAC